jgi:hypothetical protein
MSAVAREVLEEGEEEWAFGEGAFFEQSARGPERALGIALRERREDAELQILASAIGLEKEKKPLVVLRPIDQGEKRGVARSALEARERLESKLPQSALRVPGYSSAKVRHFLNHLASFEAANYLEIGTWKGSTLIAASYDNPGEFTGVDNFSQFRFRQWRSPRRHLARNAARFGDRCRFKFLEADCFRMDLGALPGAVNVFFYDGDHALESQRQVFLRFDALFADSFIALVDDWNWPEVREGTRAGFRELGYGVSYERELFSHRNGDREGWWNGLYVAVIEKARIPRTSDARRRDGRLLGAFTNL